MTLVKNGLWILFVGTACGSAGDPAAEPPAPPPTVLAAGTADAAPPPVVSEYEPLFREPSGTLDPRRGILGLWASGATRVAVESRDEDAALRSSNVLPTTVIRIARRCPDGAIVGVTVRATVALVEVTILDKRSARVGECGVATSPRWLPLCSGDQYPDCYSFAPGYASWSLGAMRPLFETPGQPAPLEFTKLSDTTPHE